MLDIKNIDKQIDSQTYNLLRWWGANSESNFVHFAFYKILTNN